MTRSRPALEPKCHAFSWLSVQEFMTFTSQLIVERSAKGSRASVKEQEYLCHVYVRNDSLAGVVIADSEYPSRVAFTLLEKVSLRCGQAGLGWTGVGRARGIREGHCVNLMAVPQDGHRVLFHLGRPRSLRGGRAQRRSAFPRAAGLVATCFMTNRVFFLYAFVQHNTMESLLERGEKLDDLVSKSEVLGTQSKAFYKTARKQNSCCAIM
eukprot:XP_022272232.1 synaptobrevin homolog YKT6 [Canis lupus familiaris]